MMFECKRCQAVVSGQAFRVTSEVDGLKLLDMIVCRLCWIDAQRLGLRTEELGRPTCVAPVRAEQGASIR